MGWNVPVKESFDKFCYGFFFLFFLCIWLQGFHFTHGRESSAILYIRGELGEIVKNLLKEVGVRLDLFFFYIYIF